MIAGTWLYIYTRNITRICTFEHRIGSLDLNYESYSLLPGMNHIHCYLVWIMFIATWYESYSLLPGLNHIHCYLVWIIFIATWYELYSLLPGLNHVHCYLVWIIFIATWYESCSLLPGMNHVHCYLVWVMHERNHYRLQINTVSPLSAKSQSMFVVVFCVSV